MYACVQAYCACNSIGNRSLRFFWHPPVPMQFWRTIGYKVLSLAQSHHSLHMSCLRRDIITSLPYLTWNILPAQFAPQTENFDDLLSESEQTAQRRQEAAEMLEVNIGGLSAHVHLFCTFLVFGGLGVSSVPFLCLSVCRSVTRAHFHYKRLCYSMRHEKLQATELLKWVQRTVTDGEDLFRKLYDGC